MLAAPLASTAALMGPVEIFSLLLTTLVLLFCLGPASRLKGMAAGFHGVAIAMIGNHTCAGARLTLGIEDLEGGVRLLPLLLGLLVVRPVIGGVIGY